jgi:hypothetical protein
MEESAVSEVIGIILIVALTVILSAIIAAYAFGLVGTMPTNYNVAVTLHKTDLTHFNMTYQGGPDHEKLTSLRITWPEASLPSPILPSDVPNPSVGQYWGPAEIVPGGRNHIIVVGHFSDEKEQVLLNAFI